MGNMYDQVGSYLKKQDFPKPKALVIESCELEAIHGEHTRKYVLRFTGTAKGLILNPTNIKKLIEITGTSESSEQVGHTVILFNDLSVEYQGNKGGIRLRAPGEGEPPVPQDLHETKEDIPF